MRPTAQQQAVIDWVPAAMRNGRRAKRNAMVVARAGTGKTSLLIECFPKMAGSVFANAYNRDIANEIEVKVKKRGLLRVRVGTSHRFGLRALRSIAPRVKVDLNGSKLFNRIFDELEIGREYRPFVRAAMNFARQRAVGILCPLNDPQAWLSIAEDYSLEEKLFTDPSAIPQEVREKMVREALKLSCKALRRSIDIGEQITDGEGMIYLPLVKNVRFEQYDWGVMDEAQDVNPARRVLFKRMLKPTGRALFVGDPKQAINAWAGADSDSMALVEKEFATEIFPLTVTFRCPRAIVERAQTIVPDYQCAPSAPQGIVRGMREHEFAALDYLKTLNPTRDAILCRNTRPLIDMALRMIRHGIPAHVEGRDLRTGLIALAQRWPEVIDLDDLSEKLEEYRDRETQRLMSRGREEQADRINDQVEALMAFIDGMVRSSPVEALVDRINELFADTVPGQPRTTISLMTIHKSKGLEFPRIFILGANRYQPSAYARSEAALEQEENLMYVSWTRAMEELIDIDVPLPSKK